MKKGCILTSENVSIVKINQPLIALESMPSVMPVVILNQMELKIVDAIRILNEPEFLVRQRKHTVKLRHIVCNGA